MTALIADFQSLARFLHRGLPLPEALARLSRRGRSSALWQSVLERVEQGDSLSAALGAHPEIPRRLFHLLEHTDDASSSLGQVAEVLRRSEQARLESRRQTLYPRLVLLGLLASSALNYWLMSICMDIFRGLSLHPPLLSRMVMGLVALYPAMFVLGLGLLPLLHREAVLLRLPIMGASVRLLESEHFVLWLSQLCEIQPLPEAVRLSAQSVSRVRMRAQLLQMAGELERGTPWREALREASWLPWLTRWMLELAEQRGLTQSSLQVVQQVLLREQELRARVLYTFLPPFTSLATLAAFGVILLSIFIPLYQLIGNM